ncbi:MAG TPA: TIM barrel protein [bacterium]|nr:TIM barrel protein [bacterium]HQO34251.1 TIM barrel protein [bacterium]HQP99913.1 TIM barrel protein [bacterium]
MHFTTRILASFFIASLAFSTSGSPAFGEETSKGWEVILCNPLLRKLEMDNVWLAAKATGAKGIEINVKSDLTCPNLFVGKETPYRLDTSKNAAKIKIHAEQMGLKTPVICAPVNLDPKGAPAWTKKLIEMAPFAGVELIYFPVTTDKFSEQTIEDSEFVRQAVAMIQEWVDLGEKHKVAITIENLSVYWNRAEILHTVLAQFPPEKFGLNLDPINLYWFGHSINTVYAITEEFAPRAKYFHVKNLAHPPEMQLTTRPIGFEYEKNSVPVPEGDLNFERIMGWLKNAGFQGYIGIEDDSLGHYPKDQRAGILQHDIQYVEGIISRLK